jgi:flagellar hook-basal body complex protein FliE
MPAPLYLNSAPPIAAPAAPDSVRPAGESPPGGGFQEVFASAVKQVESMGEDASASVERFLSGDGEDLHTTALATQRAELAFEMFQQVRNKVVSAYQEIMRMQM